MNNFDLSKFSSGKFWLTIISGLVFAYAVYVKLLSAEATASIITMVFVSYFNRPETKGEQNETKSLVK